MGRDECNCDEAEPNHLHCKQCDCILLEASEGGPGEDEICFSCEETANQTGDFISRVVIYSPEKFRG